MKITKKYFTDACGFEPKDDDLERSNCPLAGQVFHECCGWDWKRNKPKFIAKALEVLELQEKNAGPH